MANLMAVADTDVCRKTEAVQLMTGREAMRGFLPAKQVARQAVALAAADLVSSVLKGVSLELAARRDPRPRRVWSARGKASAGGVFRRAPLCAGADPDRRRRRSSGQRRDSAIRAGLAYVPQERKTEGLLLSKSVGKNLTLAILDAIRALFGVVETAQRGRIRAAGDRASPDPHTRRQ